MNIVDADPALKTVIDYANERFTAASTAMEAGEVTAIDAGSLHGALGALLDALRLRMPEGQR